MRIKRKGGELWDWDKAKGGLEGLSKAQLGMLIQVAYGWLPEYKRDLLVKVAGQMGRVNKEYKEQRGLAGLDRGVKMKGETLLKIVSVLTPDDVRRMKATGLADLAKKQVDGLDRLAAEWRSVHWDEFLDRKVWAEVWVKLRELRAALYEG